VAEANTQGTKESMGAFIKGLADQSGECAL
jgi:hypothetical protein